MFNSTPGPWKVEINGSITTLNGTPVLAVASDSEGSYLAATPADRRLAAAAPELLAACQMAVNLLSMMGSSGPVDHIRKTLVDVVTKAQGDSL